MVGSVLVVSPHLDDAVLSLGGAIAAWASAGVPVTIASVYTAGPPLETVAPSMRKFADYRIRCAEDDAAANAVGARVVRLGQIERAFRPPFLRAWSFFTTPETRAGFTTLDRVRDALAAAVTETPDRIFVPLGIGNHVDHVEALLAATDWALAKGWGDRLRFYEDLYGLARSIRTRHFVARGKTWAHWQSPLLRARRLAVVLKTIGARIAGPPLEDLLDPRLAAARWTLAPVPIRETAKLAAIACYASQTRAFGGLAGIDRALRAYHRLFGGREPVWSAS